MMMRTERAGFTLVELLIVSVLTAITLAGVYQTLILQEKSYEAATLKIHDQESLRVALGILESELREVGSIGGADIGGSDILFAGQDSVVFRAQRKTGFVCLLSRDDNWAITWVLGDNFEQDDLLLVFMDGDSLSYTDDRWDTTTVSAAQSTTDSFCTTTWPDPELQLLRLEDLDMADLRAGSPIRSYERVAYHLHDFGQLGYGLARTLPDDNDGPAYLVGGLASSGNGGLVFQYFKPSGAATTDVDSIARIRITVKTAPQTNTGVESTTMNTNLYLRNN